MNEYNTLTSNINEEAASIRTKISDEQSVTAGLESDVKIANGKAQDALNLANDRDLAKEAANILAQAHGKAADAAAKEAEQYNLEKAGHEADAKREEQRARDLKGKAKTDNEEASRQEGLADAHYMAAGDAMMEAMNSMDEAKRSKERGEAAVADRKLVEASSREFVAMEGVKRDAASERSTAA